MDDQKKTLADDQTQQLAQDGVTVAPAALVAPKLKEPFDFAQGKQKEKQPIPVIDKKSGEVDYAEADKVAKEEGDEYWESYAREIELEKQILEMGGIEKIEAGEVKVPEGIAKEMGIEPTVGIQTPMETATGFSVRGVTLDDSQLAAGMTQPTSSGLRWLVEWFIYQLLKAHFHIKKIRGTITRQK